LPPANPQRAKIPAELLPLPETWANPLSIRVTHFAECANVSNLVNTGFRSGSLSLWIMNPLAGSYSRARTTLGSLSGGGVSERPKERASKAREVKASEGSNPSATAN
jgi:hypothetical protein